jgi:hypothetical protein
MRLTVVLLTAALQRCSPDATLLARGGASGGEAALAAADDVAWPELLPGLEAAARATAEDDERGAAWLSAARGN